MSDPISEVGKAAGTFMDALKSQPLSLALVAMNLALLTYMFYWATAVQSARQESIKLILDVQKQVNELLSRCVVPPDNRRSDLKIENVPLYPLPPDVPLPIPFPGVKEP